MSPARPNPAELAALEASFAFCGSRDIIDRCRLHAGSQYLLSLAHDIRITCRSKPSVRGAAGAFVSNGFGPEADPNCPCDLFRVCRSCGPPSLFHRCTRASIRKEYLDAVVICFLPQCSDATRLHGLCQLCGNAFKLSCCAYNWLCLADPIAREGQGDAVKLSLRPPMLVSTYFTCIHRRCTKPCRIWAEACRP
jgi:hypothetical protein